MDPFIRRLVDRWARRPWSLGCVLVALLWTISTGCSTAHYRKSADNETYRLVQQFEKNLFGRTNEFRIETPYSGREPGSIQPLEIIENRLGTGSQKLSLEQALDLAVETSREYQTEKERLYLTALTLTGERHAFGPQFFARSSAGLDRASNGERSGSVSSRLGVDQALKTGGSLSVSLVNDLLRYYTGNARNSAINTLSVNLVQPVLRGFGKNNPAVEQLTQAERNVIYAVRSFSHFQNRFAIQIVNQYFNLLAQKNVIRNTYSNYLSQVTSTKRLEARSKDRANRSDVDQARQSELNVKNSYVNSVSGYLNALDQFKLTLGVPLNTKLQLDDSELEQLKAIGLIPANIDRDRSFRLAVERQLPLLNEIDRFEDSKRKIKVAASQLRPGLNILGNASLSSDAPTDYTRFDIDRVRYGVGLELDLPLDRLRQRNNYRATLVSFESQLRSLGLSLDTLKDDIDSSLRNLEQRRQNYLIQKNALQVADRRVEMFIIRQRAGELNVRDLVESQNAQISAQNAVTAALVAYQQIRLELLLTLGAIDTRSERFWFKEQLADFAPAGTVGPAGPTVAVGNEELLTPDQIFNNQ